MFTVPSSVMACLRLAGKEKAKHRMEETRQLQELLGQEVTGTIEQGEQLVVLAHNRIKMLSTGRIIDMDVAHV